MSTGFACTSIANDCRPSIIVTSGRVRFSDTLSHETIVCVTYDALVKNMLFLKGVKRVTDVSANPTSKRITLYYLHHQVVLEPGRTSSTEEELARYSVQRPSGFSLINEVVEWEYFFRHKPVGASFARFRKTPSSSFPSSSELTSVFEAIVHPRASAAASKVAKRENVLFVHGGGQHGSCLMGVAVRVLKDTETPFARFAGASFGAAIAALAALRLDILDQLVHVCERMGLGHPDGFERPLNGDVALAFVLGLFPDGIVEQTLGELDLNLDVVVTRVADFEPVVLNADTAPNVRLVDALRASMGIPVFIGCYKIDGVSYMDGDFTSYTYVEGLDEQSVVIGTSDTTTCLFSETITQAFVSHGSIIEKVKFMFEQFFEWFLEKYNFVGRARRAYVTIRDPSVSICGGPTGSTAWHLLNFEHGLTTTSV